MNNKKKAVVIDDDVLVCRVIGKMLSERNMEPLEITNGTDAATVLRKEGKNVALAIVDLVLPHGQTGWDIIDIIKGNTVMSEMSVIVITGARISQEEIARLEKRVDHVIYKKDFSIDGFSRLLDGLLQEKKK